MRPCVKNYEKVPVFFVLRLEFTDCFYLELLIVWMWSSSVVKLGSWSAFVPEDLSGNFWPF